VTGNAWCRALGITPPKLEAVAHHREANTFSLLLAALLERGEPMTLLEVAERFEAAGVAERGRALLSLQRCKPGRPPVYREGDLYHLDPHDADLDLWAFRLDLRPPKRPPVATPVRHEAPPADPDVRLTVGELDEAFRLAPPLCSTSASTRSRPSWATNWPSCGAGSKSMRSSAPSTSVPRCAPSTSTRASIGSPSSAHPRRP
jgi:hypothetical protein